MSNPQIHSQPADAIASDPLRLEAAQWVVRINDPDATETDYLEWQAWLAVDPRHGTLYAACEQAWLAACDAPGAAWPTREELRADRYSGTEKISTWLRRPNDRQRHARSWFAYAAALGALTIGGLAGSYWLHSRGVILETAVAEQRSIRLDDGSRVELSGESRVRVAMRDDVRYLFLDQGEAYFDVAPDPERPFIVSVDGHEVRAVGTEFDIEKASDRVVVTVAHGIVQVSKNRSTSIVSASGSAVAEPVLQLRAGEQAAANEQGIHRLPDKAAAMRAASWREGRLEYLQEELRYVVNDVNRYVERKIVIDDPEIARMQFTGTVFPDHLDEWLLTLPGTFPVQVDDAGRQRIITRRTQ